MFCLCHGGQKLLTDSDYISLFGDKDGDQMQFVHHASSAYNLVKIKSEREDPDSDDEPTVRGGHKEGKKSGKDDGHQIEILEDEQEDAREGSDDDDGDDISRCEYRLSNLFTCLFPYRKLPNSHTAVEDKSNSFKNWLHFPAINMNLGSKLGRGSNFLDRLSEMSNTLRDYLY